MTKTKGKTKFPWLAVIALAMAQGGVYTAPYVHYYIYDETLAAFGCSNTELGLMMTVMIIIATVNSPFGGIIADRYSPRLLVALSAILQTPSIVALAMFPHLAWLRWWTYCSIGFTGGFCLYPAILKGIRVACKENYAAGCGVFEGLSGLFTGIFNSIGVGVFAMFTNKFFGWQVAYAVMGIASAVGGIAVLIFLKNGAYGDDTPKADDKPKHKSSLKDVLFLMKRPNIWACGFAMTGLSAISKSAAYFTPYFTNVLGVSVVFTGFVAIFRRDYMAVAISPLSGAIASRIGSTAKVMRVALITCMICVVGILALKPGGAGVVSIATALTFISGMFVIVGKAPQWSCLEEAHIPVEIMGSAVFIASTCATGINDGIMPLIAGICLDNYQGDPVTGFRIFYGLVLAMAAFGIFCTYALQRIDKNWKIKHADELAALAERSAAAAQ